ncbi:MAG TPA: DnaD domain protein [Eubacteriales bacterium]|jgi:hypothetical protein|nr:DnaD domain protein [Eubacteriales bacterium]HRU84923.1 DnaD domain protein [Eubacteriales bacterium]
MSFIRFSNDYLIESFTLVDNLFINEYLPYADEKQIKAYIYGLYLCYRDGGDNTIENFSNALDIEIDELINIFTHFEDNGLVQIISKQPFEVKYLSLKRAMQPAKKYKPEKYADFNKELQQLFPSRMLTPNEYNEYYKAMDDLKIQQDAMLMIVQYCISLKGAEVRYPYILTVARNWALDGILTADAVEVKLTEYEAQSENMRAVMRALGKRTQAGLEEKQYLSKWLGNWGFSIESIVYAAKNCKAKSFKGLDAALDEFYRMSVFTAREMEKYREHREKLKELAVKINRTIGVYYETLDHIIEVYIAPWVQKGFDEDALLTIAHYCFLRGVRTLEGVGGDVSRFFKMGLLTRESIDAYIAQQMENDAAIGEVLTEAGVLRRPTLSDRAYFKVWTVDWGFSHEVIKYAAGLAAARPYPIPYINQLLAGYKNKRVYSLDEIKKLGQSEPSDKPKEKAFATRAYTAQELSAAFPDIYNFDNLDDI